MTYVSHQVEMYVDDLTIAEDREISLYNAATRINKYQAGEGDVAP
jgi:hypothetical protein